MSLTLLGHTTPEQDARLRESIDDVVISGIFTTANEAMLLAQLKGGDSEAIREAVTVDPHWARFCEIAAERDIETSVPVEKVVVGWAKAVTVSR